MLRGKTHTHLVIRSVRSEVFCVRRKGDREEMQEEERTIGSPKTTNKEEKENRKVERIQTKIKVQNNMT